MSCDEPQPRSRPVFLGGKTRTDPESAWEGLLSRPLRDLGTRVSHHAYTHALETRQRSLPHCLMRVSLMKTAGRHGPDGRVCRSTPLQPQRMWSEREAWQSEADDGIGHAADQGPCGAIDTPPLLLSHCLHHEHTVSFIASRHKSTRPFWNASGFRCGGPWASPGGSWGQTPCSRGRSRYDSVYSATAVSFSSRPIPGFSGKGRRPCRATGGWR